MKKKSKGMSTKASYPLWVAAPTALIYTMFTVVPLLMSVYLSFTDWNINRLDTPTWKGIANYVTVFSDPIFTHSIFNTLIYAAGTATLKVVFGLLLALALVKNSRINSALRTLFYTPCVLSSTVIGLLFTSILTKYGLLNNFLSSIGLSALAIDWLGFYKSAMFSVIFLEGWMWAGFNMFIFISGLQAISTEYYECAEILGISKMKQFWSITIPLLMPSFTVNLTLNITGGLKVFDMIYVLTNGGPGFDTQVVSTYAYRSFGTGLLGQSCAASVILCVIVMTLTFVFNRFITSKEVEV
ncbi:MAG: sugar ABC transporter permease [Faecalibacterium sp.]